MGMMWSSLSLLYSVGSGASSGIDASVEAVTGLVVCAVLVAGMLVLLFISLLASSFAPVAVDRSTRAEEARLEAARRMKAKAGSASRALSIPMPDDPQPKPKPDPQPDPLPAASSPAAPSVAPPPAPASLVSIFRQPGEWIAAPGPGGKVSPWVGEVVASGRSVDLARLAELHPIIPRYWLN